jgi:hypothetical protein
MTIMALEQVKTALVKVKTRSETVDLGWMDWAAVVAEVTMVLVWSRFS